MVAIAERIGGKSYDDTDISIPRRGMMAGRRTFFSFHYDRDIWRASNVRNIGSVDPVARAGLTDASLWEEAKKKGDSAIQALILDGLRNTSVTVVLIGAETASRRWVKYEIEQSIERGNGLLGVRIHTLKDQHGNTDVPGAIPKALSDGGYPVYGWDRDKIAAWVEKAAVAAGKFCLAHNRQYCNSCR